MVKLPVIVYNRKSQDDVYADAINIRRKLEPDPNTPVVLFTEPGVGYRMAEEAQPAPGAR